PHRVTDTLKAIAKVDSQRRVSIGRELTKKFEQLMTLPVTQMLETIQNGDIPMKGEFVILIEGASPITNHSWFEDLTVKD
ncbi:rRNA (cytidine-2'-O-)-methyltransferase, partial [Staphylococcus xylosus]